MSMSPNDVIMNIMYKTKTPLSIIELQRHLRKSDLNPNAYTNYNLTTIVRNLVSRDYLTSLNLGEEQIHRWIISGWGKKDWKRSMNLAKKTKFSIRLKYFVEYGITPMILLLLLIQGFELKIPYFNS